MLLTFSEPKFEKRLLDNFKGSTFREDKKNRWKVGMTAHLWMHNPRNVKLKPHHIKDDKIFDIDYVILIPVKDRILFYFDADYKERYKTFSLKTNITRLNSIAFCDGFDDWEDMKQWFMKRGYTDTKGYKMKRLCFESFFTYLPF